MEEIEKEVQENKSETGDIKKANKKLKIVLIGVGVLIVLALILAFALPWNILLSKNKSTFSKLILNDAKSLSTFIEELSENKVIKFLSEDSESAYDLTSTIATKDFNISSQIIADKDFFALKADNLYDKFILIDPNNLDTVWNYFEIYGDNLPNKLVTEKDLLDVLSLNKSEQKKVEKSLKKYFEIILTNVDESMFIAQDDVKVFCKNEEIVAKSIEMQLSELDFINVERKILTELKKDDVLDIFVDKAAKVEQFYKNAGYNYEEINLTKEDVIKSIDTYLENLNEIEKMYNEQQANGDESLLVIRYYYLEDYKPLKREIAEKYTFNGENGEDVILAYTTADNENEDYYELTSLYPSEYSAYYETFANTVTKQDNKTINDISYVVEGHIVVLDEETFEYKWDIIDHTEEYVLELIDGDEMLISFSGKEENSLAMDIKVANNVLDGKVQIPTSEDEKMTITAIYTKNISKTKEDVKNAGALDLSEENKEGVKEEIEKIKTNLTNLGLFAL